MHTAISNAYTGVRAYQGGLDQVADNVANVNTPGYKSSEASFSDLVYREFGERRLPVDPDPALREPQGGNGSRVSSVIPSFEQGDMQQTGRPLDLAVEGEGLFRVVRPDGTEAYTRQGSFFKDAEGNLVTAAGDILETDFTLEEISAEDVSISEEGEVHAVDEDGEREHLGDLEVYRFTNPDGLEAEGDNLYVETGVSGEPMGGVPGEEGRGVLRQNMLEGSNVELYQEMSDMIKMQRALSSSTRAVSTANELWVLALQAKR